MFLYQNPKAFFIEVGKSVLKSIWTLRELKIFKTILKKKNKGGEFTLSNFKTYYKYKWIKIVCHWHVCVCVWSRSVVSDSSQPHGLQPTRLLRPWDFPGKRTGVGCHCTISPSVVLFRKIKITTSWMHKFLTDLEVKWSCPVMSDSLRPRGL